MKDHENQVENQQVPFLGILINQVDHNFPCKNISYLYYSSLTGYHFFVYGCTEKILKKEKKKKKISMKLHQNRVDNQHGGYIYIYTDVLNMYFTKMMLEVGMAVLHK